jgi:ribosomal protein L11 methyltransferase
MPFLELRFDLGPLDPQAAEQACFGAGALSVTFSDARDDAVLEPAPGEFRLWPATRVAALFPGQTEPEEAARALAEAVGLPQAVIVARTLADRAWELEWRDHFHAMRFGRRLWVAPSHEHVRVPGAIVVRLDPGLAFGTGTHPTTAMCLEWLDAHLSPDDRVVDYGSGSGILGLAAAKLGAARVECFDIDPQALSASRDGAVRNGLAARVRTVAHAEELAADADVLVANILSGPLCALAPRFATLVRAGGRVVLAGLLESQAAEVTEAYRAWFDMRRFGAREQWVGLAGVRSSRVE